LVATGPVVASSAGVAYATTCSMSSHCYLLDYWGNANTNKGDFANIDVECLYEADPSSNFVDEEIWEGTANSTNVSYWVETGMTEGTHLGLWSNLLLGK